MSRQLDETSTPWFELYREIEKVILLLEVLLLLLLLLLLFFHLYVLVLDFSASIETMMDEQ